MYNYEKIPEHIRESVKGYVEKGIPVGSFLTAVICNDLRESFAMADDINRDRMFDIVSFFYNEPPITCWGSRENMDKWISGFREKEKDYAFNKNGD